MNLLGINLIATLRQRIGAVLGAVGASLACCVCGAIMTFVMAPGQALQAARIARLPAMDASTVASAATGDTLLITGTLAGNPPALPGSQWAAYSVEEWKVTVTEASEDSSESRSGRWEKTSLSVPELNLDVGGQPVHLSAVENVQLSGNLHEEIVLSDSAIEATWESQPMPDGSLRYEGLQDGDVTTVLGKKDASGGIAPDHLFAGNRAAFETSQRKAASGLLYSGICAMALAPVVLIGGILAAIFGRRRF